MAAAERLPLQIVAMAMVLCTGLVAQGMPAVSFESLARAESSLNARIRQTRSVFQIDGQGGAEWHSLVESLVLGGCDRDGNARFRLTLDSVPGLSLDPVELEQRRTVHASHAGYLQQFETFRVENPVAAARNYTLLHLDDRERLGRATHRVAVVPRRFGRSAWILELDAATLYPLFSAEVSAFGVVVATLEVTTFALATPAELSAVTWWAPTMLMSRFSDATSAAASLGLVRPAAMDGAALPADYALIEVRAVRNDLRPESSLVFVHGDGIDSLFVIDTYGAPPPPLPWSSPGDPTAPYAIFSYADQNVAQLMFHVHGVRTMVIGRSSHLELGLLAESLLRQATGQ